MSDLAPPSATASKRLPSTMPVGVPSLVGAYPPPKKLSTATYLFRMTKDLLTGFDERAFNELIVERRFLWVSSYLISDPEGVRRVLVDNARNYLRIDSLPPTLAPLVGAGLVTTEGDVWRRHRLLMAPVFTPRTLAGYGAIMTSMIAEHMSSWAEFQDGHTINVTREMMDLTLDIILRSACPTHTPLLRALIAEAVETYFPELMLSLWSLVPGVKHVWSKHARRLGKRNLERLNRELYRMIDHEMKRSVRPASDDLLSKLIGAQDDSGAPLLTPTEVRDQLMTVITAGHETSAMGLTWIFYVLSQLPEVEAQVLAELTDVLDGRSPEYGDIERLIYLRKVVDESFRLYPPVHSLGWRQAECDDEICGRPIAKGSIVTIVPWIIHRHKLLWDNPNEFIPERFDRDQQSQRSRFSYIPFNVGPHVCLGAAFATTEMLLVLASILPMYKLRLTQEGSVVPRGYITLHSTEDMLMSLSRR